MRVAVAVLMAVGIASIGLGMLRSIRRTPASIPLDRVEAPPPDVRIIYWCGVCGTEVLLLRKGSESPPRHCGEAMVRREEVASS